jgi:hypothetical protein
MDKHALLYVLARESALRKLAGLTSSVPAEFLEQLVARGSRPMGALGGWVPRPNMSQLSDAQQAARVAGSGLPKAGPSMHEWAGAAREGMLPRFG